MILLASITVRPVQQFNKYSMLLKIFVFGYEKLVYLQTQGEVIKIWKSHKLAE